MTIDRRAWFSPAVLIHLGTALVMIGVTYGVMSSKMEVVTVQNTRVEAEVTAVRGEIKELRNNQEQVIRAQEQMRYFEIRLAGLEGFRAAQIEYNGSFMTKLAVLQKESR
jgi:TolA-binding protein